MIRLIKSSFYKENETKKKLLDFILKANILSMDKECKIFENRFARNQKRKFAVFVNSGSSANLILIQALLNLKRIYKNNKIGVSALTWPTNVMPLIQLGLKPIVIDCEKKTLNISPETLSSHLFELKVLFLTNALGFSDRIDKIKKICDKNNIIFLEDNCESLGSKGNRKLLGNFGLASTFSFFVGHHISTIEGGMVCTDDEELYKMLIMIRAHGWDRNLSMKEQGRLKNKYDIDDFYAKYTFYDLSYNVRPTEINGFLGNIQIKYWNEIIKKRENNFKLFYQKIKENSDFVLLKLDHMDIISNFAMPVVCKNKRKVIKYKEKFTNNKIEIRPIIAGNITKQPFYKKYIGENKNCKNANFIHENGFYFPNNPELKNNEIKLILNSLEK